MEIKIGTSGYSFDDWKGSFYPENIAKGKMFDHYVKYFSTVEINSTYYRIPHPAVMANIEKKSPENFEFIVKTPAALTHTRNIDSKSVDDFINCLKPLAEPGKLKGLLAQFPYSFKYSASSLDYIKYCRDIFRDYRLFVEFRHNEWVNRNMYDTLKEHDVGYVSVDEPSLPGLLKSDLFNTTDTAYLRLHGRNGRQWWNGGPLRYDYNYNRAELEEWREKIKKLEGKAKKIFIFFNNCHLGQAVKNAREMTETLNL